MSDLANSAQNLRNCTIDLEGFVNRKLMMQFSQRAQASSEAMQNASLKNWLVGDFQTDKCNLCHSVHGMAVLPRMRWWRGCPGPRSDRVQWGLSSGWIKRAAACKMGKKMEGKRAEVKATDDEEVSEDDAEKLDQVGSGSGREVDKKTNKSYIDVKWCSFVQISWQKFAILDFLEPQNAHSSTRTQLLKKVREKFRTATHMTFRHEFLNAHTLHPALACVWKKLMNFGLHSVPILCKYFIFLRLYQWALRMTVDLLLILTLHANIWNYPERNDFVM